MTIAQQAAFDAAVALSQGMLQSHVGVAKATLTGTTLQTAIDGAYRGHHTRVVEAANAYGMNPSGSREALAVLKLPIENVVSTDGTPFTLVGGRYFVSVSHTFEYSGFRTLVNADGEVFASFNDIGTQALDLKYGIYHWVVDDPQAPALTARVQSV